MLKEQEPVQMGVETVRGVLRRQTSSIRICMQTQFTLTEQPPRPSHKCKGQGRKDVQKSFQKQRRFPFEIFRNNGRTTGKKNGKKNSREFYGLRNLIFHGIFIFFK